MTDSPAAEPDHPAAPADSLPVYGQSGTVAGHVSAAEWAARPAVVTLTLVDGRHMFVERDRLRDAGAGRLEFGQGHAPAAATPPTPTPPKSQRDGDGSDVGQAQTLSVIEEQPHVTKRRVERGVVRVHRRVREEHKQIDVPLTSERVEVERVPADRVVDEMEPPRTEGDTTIIPVYEEVLVVQRKFRVREEIRLTRVRTQRPSHHTVTLRRHEVEIERVAPRGEVAE